MFEGVSKTIFKYSCVAAEIIAEAVVALKQKKQLFSDAPERHFPSVSHHFFVNMFYNDKGPPKIDMKTQRDGDKSDLITQYLQVSLSDEFRAFVCENKATNAVLTVKQVQRQHHTWCITLVHCEELNRPRATSRANRRVVFGPYLTIDKTTTLSIPNTVAIWHKLELSRIKQRIDNNAGCGSLLSNTETYVQPSNGGNNPYSWKAYKEWLKDLYIVGGGSAKYDYKYYDQFAFRIMEYAALYVRTALLQIHQPFDWGSAKNAGAGKRALRRNWTPYDNKIIAWLTNSLPQNT